MATIHAATQALEHPLRRAEAGVRMLLTLAPCEPHVVEDTPGRVVRAFCEMTRGYLERPDTILEKRFPIDADEIVAVKDIEFVSLCEHHLLPFTGVAHVGYLPNGEVVGLSKIARLVDCYARRLQLQERLCYEIARSIEHELVAPAVGVVIIAAHSCLTCRGAQKQRTSMITSAMLGLFRKDRAARQEFLDLIGL